MESEQKESKFSTWYHGLNYQAYYNKLQKAQSSTLVNHPWTEHQSFIKMNIHPLRLDYRYLNRRQIFSHVPVIGPSMAGRHTSNGSEMADILVPKQTPSGPMTCQRTIALGAQRSVQKSVQKSSLKLSITNDIK